MRAVRPRDGRQASPSVRQRTEAPVKPEGDDFDRANPNSDLSERLIADGGFTIDPADGSGPTVGYVVARPGHLQDHDPREEFEAGGERHINEYLRKLRDEEANPDVMLGGWYDARHDEIVLDRPKWSTRRTKRCGSAGNATSRPSGT